MIHSPAHAKTSLRYHLVFCPKYRRPIFRDSEIAAFATSEVRRLSDYFKIELLTYSVQPDHVHVFFAAHPSVNLIALVAGLKVNLTKGLLSRFASVRSTYPKRSVWARGYFLATCGVDEKTIRNYIRFQ